MEILEAKEKEFFMIFMDHFMPVLDGIETMKIIADKIKKNSLKDIPVLALTANSKTAENE